MTKAKEISDAFKDGRLSFKQEVLKRIECKGVVRNYCQDCGTYLAKEILGYHNSNHTIKKKILIGDHSLKELKQEIETMK